MKKNIFIFPGQGSQNFGMGKDFYDNDALAREMIDKASQRLDLDFTKLLFEENDRLELTEFTQPAILLVSTVAHALFIKSYKEAPLMALGHSLGEFSALSAVGAIDYLDAVELVHKRGLFMKEACENINAGMMALIGLSDDKVEDITTAQRELGKKVWAANYNCDGQIVVAGDKDDLASLENTFKEEGAKRALLLNMSVASHCPLLQSAIAPLGEYLNNFIKDDFLAPVVSNVTANLYSSKKEALELLSNQLIKPVKYKQSIENVEANADRFIEFGATVLKGLNRRSTKKPTLCITDMESLEKVLSELS
ncbi:ACP S-malonyltransferase [Sulfurospirillum arcachonense]|uniref:ACP S-malonyltransferase n=1 Tax=Sulfurospirillum arcachonense TaxID=57666 RepID=UPI00046A6E99|nr:ACP S-malonyltransferase [Sulfurospirillum arcachonense]